MPSSSIADRLAAVRSRIDTAARTAGRDPGEVRLLVATKTQDADAVRAAVEAGVDLIGENRVQELVAKAPALADRVAAGTLEVHMIGHLQRNKINQVLSTSTGVETVDALALARALSTRCVRDDRTLDVMVQVNVSGEDTKSGVVPGDAVPLALDVAALPGLRLTGFMTIGAHLDAGGEPAGDAAVRAGFARLRAIRDEVLASDAPGTADARELSMGMTTDLDLAIAEGATIVRVGTAVFGPRAR
ncbi:YggS family pyridoxal phosphate-dependent enzyme [Myceligenerans indicum]|uniref:Pyridoxal phosphate homeostasis protein n=1 Tax=Myceligenerans indicum TaxID=2593663 RepID=A0ABS1LQ73_9MICO|nr:YggS family pyridoxal phosphate-dependent enzyme [Myceligenerans indicum]MBL0887687.1 YggS family pyridoxal phosphate-dependent enzyme [Myceligenerans indicum]